jgi:hypothetical protein
MAIKNIPLRLIKLPNNDEYKLHADVVDGFNVAASDFLYAANKFDDSGNITKRGEMTFTF